MSNMIRLLSERPIVINSRLAKAIGLAQSIIIETIISRCEERDSASHDNKKWIGKTYSEWVESDFCFMPEQSLKHKMIALEKAGLVISCQPEPHNSRRKYYRVNMDEVERKLAASETGKESVL